MRRNSFATAAISAALCASVPAHAVCTAGTVNPDIVESTPTSTFTNHGDGTVTHLLTGLMWKQCAEGFSGPGCANGIVESYNWSQALAVATTSTFAGYDDWRLPNRKELESLLEYCGYAPSMNTDLFPNAYASFYWSSTSYAPIPSDAWYVDFGWGGSATTYKASTTLQARLVRGGQAVDRFDAQHPPFALLGVTSRKSHGAAGVFDATINHLMVPGGAVSTESRTIGNGHTIVFQFNSAVSNAGSVSVAPVGTAMATYLGNEVLVTLTGVPDNQRETVSLFNVNGSLSPFPVTIGFLAGDANTTRSVNSSDISAVKARSGQTTDGTNFRFDLNASGAVNSSDISAVKARSGLVLPP